jgi:hypothetical protein
MDNELDDEINEKDALATGLLLLAHKYKGDDDFSRGMRLLQERLKKSNLAHKVPRSKGAK